MTIIRMHDWGLGFYKVSETKSKDGSVSRSEQQIGATRFGGGLNAAGFHNLTEEQSVSLLRGEDTQA